MQIVIDIPKKVAERLVEDGLYGIRVNDGKTLVNAVMKGAVLPKGHGRLGDLDALWDKFLKYSDYEGAGKNYTGDEELIHRNSVMYVVENAPTVVAADTEVEK